MRLFCPECKAPIAVDEVDLGTGLAKCRGCQSVFRIGDDPSLAGLGAKPSMVPRPESLIRAEGAGELVFVRRWFTAGIVAMAVFTLFWDGFLTLWYYLAFRDPHAPLVMKLFPLVHVSVGVLITYSVAAGFVNRTWVEVGPGHVSVRHGPLPWPGNVSIATGGLKQLYCEQKAHQGRYGMSFTYNLVAVMADGSRRNLLKSLKTPDVPRYLEEQMEKYLRIRDVAVSGEFRG